MALTFLALFLILPVVVVFSEALRKGVSVYLATFADPDAQFAGSEGFLEHADGRAHGIDAEHVACIAGHDDHHHSRASGRKLAGQVEATGKLVLTGF